MNIIGGRKYVEIPGGSVHELPPLLLKDGTQPSALGQVVALAERMVESDALIPESLCNPPDAGNSLGNRKFNLAINLAEQYTQFVTHWSWGESILEWIRQCEATFETKPILRPLLRPDVWPHADRSSFVTLLADKRVSGQGVDLENAVGYRLTFRQPPPIDFFSDKFLFLLNSSLAEKAYETWSSASEENFISLPPERFHFFVMGTSIREV
jgi:hypothetical protein